MSGGSWDYVCYRIQDAADRLCCCGVPERQALGKHMQKIAHAMHEIEWVDSADSSHPADSKAIAAVFDDLCHAKVMDETLTEIKRLLEQIETRKSA